MEPIAWAVLDGTDVLHLSTDYGEAESCAEDCNCDIVPLVPQPRQWVSVEGKDLDRELDALETVWVFDEPYKNVFLAEFIRGNGFNTLGSSCDSEGINSERLTGITHYMRLVEPAPPEVK